jgi:hypothetical protein
LTNVLTRLTASTWRASLRVPRLLYTAVVCPAITTCGPAWWAPPDVPLFLKGVREELQKAENQCLIAIARAYRATPIRSPQAEVGVPPMPLHMSARRARF